MPLVVDLFIADKFFIQRVALELGMHDLLHMAAVELHISVVRGTCSEWSSPSIMLDLTH